MVAQLVRGAKLLRRAGLAQLQALPLPPYTAQRRDQSLDLLDTLRTHLEHLDDAIATAALAHPDAPRLLTHPGVGPPDRPGHRRGLGDDQPFSRQQACRQLCRPGPHAPCLGR